MYTLSKTKHFSFDWLTDYSSSQKVYSVDGWAHTIVLVTTGNTALIIDDNTYDLQSDVKRSRIINFTLYVIVYLGNKQVRYVVSSP